MRLAHHEVIRHKEDRAVRRSREDRSELVLVRARDCAVEREGNCDYAEAGVIGAGAPAPACEDKNLEELLCSRGQLLPSLLCLFAND